LLRAHGGVAVSPFLPLPFCARQKGYVNRTSVKTNNDTAKQQHKNNKKDKNNKDKSKKEAKKKQRKRWFAFVEGVVQIFFGWGVLRSSIAACILIFLFFFISFGVLTFLFFPLHCNLY